MLHVCVALGIQSNGDQYGIVCVLCQVVGVMIHAAGIWCCFSAGYARHWRMTGQAQLLRGCVDQPPALVWRG